MTKETDGPSFLDHDGAKEEPLDLLAKLRRLAGDDAQRYVDLLFPTSDPDASEAQKKHNARTAAYKRSKALRLAPDSEAIAQACSFAVLSIVSRTDDFARALASMVVKELTDAGYDRHETPCRHWPPHQRSPRSQARLADKNSSATGTPAGNGHS